jgi:cytochrome c oxidase subunit IV
MNRIHRHLLYGWLGLQTLIAVEFACSYLPLPRGLRPVLMVPALAMVAVVGFVFMRVATGPSIVRIFALASLFWLLILLGLGMMDPLTRAIYPAH